MPNPWDNDPIVGTAPQQSNGPVYGPPPKAPAPRDPLAMQLDQLQIQQKQNDLSNAPLDTEIKRMELEQKRKDLAKSAAENDVQPALDEIANVIEAAKRAKQRSQHWFQTGFGSDLIGSNTPEGRSLRGDLSIIGSNAAFDRLQRMRDQSKTGGALGSISEKELELLQSSVAALDPGQSDADFQRNMDTVIQHYSNVYNRLSGASPAQTAPETDPRAAIQQDGQVVYDNNAGEQVGLTQDATKTVHNPALAGVRGEYLVRLQRGDGPGEIVQFLRSAGVTDPKLLATAVQQANFRRKNPNVPIEKYNTDQLDLMDIPLSSTEGAMNNLGQSATGAYAMRAGNAVTANNLDSIVGATGGNAERARIGLDQASQNHPVAGLAGDLSGGITAALGAEAALGAAGAGAGVGRALAADTLYGASAGAGAADNGDRFSGAVKGGLAGLVGSVGGQAVAKGVGSAISPTGGRLADLYEQGVRPTPGQRFVNSGVAGRALNNIEENLGSVPVVGSMIRGARQDARDQWQVAAFNSSLGEIGEKLPKGMKPGTAPHQFAQQKFNAVYDKARSGMKVAADEQLASEVGQLGEQIGNLAEPSIRRFETIIRNTVLRRVGSEIDGEAYKKIQSELGKTIRGIRKSPSGDGELADALDELKGIIDNAARRHSDPEAVALLDAADRGYAKFVQIEQASGRGGVGKDAGTFSPNDFASAVKGNGQRVRSKAYNQGQGLMQDFAAQGNNLVDRIPNSGSPERLMAAGTLAGGAQYMEPSTLGVLGIIGALYAPGVRKGLAGAMAPRGPKAKAIADQVRKRARIAGAGGAAALTQTTGGQ
jgi:hypothetical protein